METSLLLKAKEKDLGDGFIVRRALPSHRKRMVGPFIFWDHLGPVELDSKKDMKVRAHPHIGLSTLTYLLDGWIVHRDSLGNEMTIEPFEINWMTSGRGIVHSERCHPKEDETVSLHALQIWIALPKEFEEVEPRFDHFKEAQIPKLWKGECKLTLVAGELLEEKSPVPVFSDLFYLFGESSKDESFNLDLREGHESALYVLEGEVKINGSESVGPGEILILNPMEKVGFEVQANSRFAFFGGLPFPEKRHIYWNLVSSDPQRIEEAKLQWERDEFEPVINESERIPLPKE